MERRDAALVLDARVGAGLEHHLDEGLAEGALGGGFRVEPADGGVEGCVAVDAGDGVAFEVWLVEEEVYDFVCFYKPSSAKAVPFSFPQLHIKIKAAGKTNSSLVELLRGIDGSLGRWWFGLGAW